MAWAGRDFKDHLAPISKYCRLLILLSRSFQEIFIVIIPSNGQSSPLKKNPDYRNY